jgi:hypothetical protein
MDGGVTMMPPKKNDSVEAPPLVLTPTPPSPAPTCHSTGCTEKPLVQWRRRLTPDELAVELAIEQGKRDAAFLLRDTQKPPPVVAPMPTGADYVRAVYACGQHAIGIDAAALVHQATCAGPNSTILPSCGCTPEPTPEPEPVVEQPLPAHWVTAMAGGS